MAGMALDLAVPPYRLSGTVVAALLNHKPLDGTGRCAHQAPYDRRDGDRLMPHLVILFTPEREPQAGRMRRLGRHPSRAERTVGKHQS